MGETFHLILVPVDFSSHSAEALRYAATFAERFAASLLVLHVLTENSEPQMTCGRLEPYNATPEQPGFGSEFQPKPYEVPEATAIDLHDRAYAALQRFLPPQLEKWPMELRVVSGRPGEEILFLARQERVDLIVMGTHGRMGLEYVAMGSIAEQMVRQAPCPVFTVKRPSP